MITKDMRITKVMKEYPETYDIFADYGLECSSCMQAKYETIEQLSVLHGINLEYFLQELNAMLESVVE